VAVDEDDPSPGVGGDGADGFDFQGIQNI